MRSKDSKAGSKTDVYEAFRRMLQRGEVPASIKELLAESQQADDASG